MVPVMAESLLVTWVFAFEMVAMPGEMGRPVINPLPWFRITVSPVVNVFTPPPLPAIVPPFVNKYSVIPGEGKLTPKNGPAPVASIVLELGLFIVQSPATRVDWMALSPDVEISAMTSKEAEVPAPG